MALAPGEPAGEPDVCVSTAAIALCRLPATASPGTTSTPLSRATSRSSSLFSPESPPSPQIERSGGSDLWHWTNLPMTPPASCRLPDGNLRPATGSTMLRSIRDRRRRRRLAGHDPVRRDTRCSCGEVRHPGVGGRQCRICDWGSAGTGERSIGQERSRSGGGSRCCTRQGVVSERPRDSVAVAGVGEYPLVDHPWRQWSAQRRLQDALPARPEI